MKILHTADWHLNTKLGRLNLNPDILTGLEHIAKLLEEHQVDVMLVAGDFFSERGNFEQMRSAISDIRRIFTPFLQRGGRILGIAGNHDSEVFIETLRDAISLVASTAQSRFYVTASPDLLLLPDRNGTEVQFALLPYPTPRCYLRGENQSYSTLEEKHRHVQQGFHQILGRIRTEKIKPNLPAVLVSHIHVRGATGHTLYKISESEETVFEPSEIPTSWAYTAFGHIHKPGPAVPNTPHVRYCGSVARLDAAERDDEKSVTIFEVGPAGLVGEVQVVPLPARPFYQVTIYDPETQIPRLRVDYPLASEALVHYTLRYEPHKHQLNALTQEIDTIFPYWYSRSIERQNTQVNSVAHLLSSSEGSSEDGIPSTSFDVPATVRAYLGDCFQKHPERDDLMALAESLLAQE